MTEAHPTEQASIEPTRWEVRPAGIEHTRFADPESFYLTIRRGRWQDKTTFVVSPCHQDAVGFTSHGRVVYLRHDVNAKHAHRATFEEAVALARSLADGHLPSPEYRYWRAAEATRWPAQEQ